MALAATIVWMAFYDRWTPASWTLPTDYLGDAHEVLARIKAAAEGETWPLRPQEISRLGAPFGAHWNSYPTPDKPLMLLLGGLSHVVGLFAAANLGLLLAQVLAALAFYGAARWLRVRWEWAGAGALLFAFTYHTFHRGLAHFSFVFTWTIPLGLLAVWLVARSRRLEWRSGGALICGAAAVALGAGNPYYFMFWGHLLVWALAAQWCGARRRANLQIGLATGALALAVFFGSNAELWMFPQEPAGQPLLARNYHGTERYALKPMELFIPPPFHRAEALAFFGHRYNRWSEWRGEPYLSYLGLVGVAALLWLVAASVRAMLARRAPPGQVLPLTWIVAYCTVGGLTNLVSFFTGFQLFRATNRAAIFLSALVLVYLVVRLSRLTAHWAPGWRGAAALLLVAVGLADQLPRRQAPEVRARIASDVASDRQLGRELERVLPPGARVFQLPILGFPEVQTPHLLTDYEHFRPFLVTETLHFSYGAAKYRARSRWQRDLERLPVSAMVRRLEEAGFAALYLNRKGYEDRGEALLRELQALGHEPILTGAGGQQVVVRLNPVYPARPPLGRGLTFGQGWHPRTEAGVRWAYDDAVASYFNPHSVPVPVRLEFELMGVSPRELILEQNGREVHRWRLGTEPLPCAPPGLVLSPGVNRFKFRSPEPARRLGAGRYQLRSFGLREGAVRVGELAVPSGRNAAHLALPGAADPAGAAP